MYWRKFLQVLTQTYSLSEKILDNASDSLKAAEDQ
uniref:Uncharacterized protein n=1 Tax=Rhizophora mucronata TaxID=61149 RepID=A0A2P2QBZ8_RHIMU